MILFYLKSKILNVDKFVLAGGVLLLFCFIIPLNVYSIGADRGIGIQGSFYRYQETAYGPILITLAQDIWYVTSGIYSGRTALSIVLWVTGSSLLVTATLVTLTRTDYFNRYMPTLSGFLLIGAGALYVGSCIAQFGLFLNGNAGISLPFGGFILIMLGIGMMMPPSLLHPSSSKNT